MILTRRIVVRSMLVMLAALATVSVLTYEFILVAGREDVDRLLRDEGDPLVASFAAEAADGAGSDGVVSPPEALRAARTALTVHPSGPRHVAAITVDGTRVQASGGPADVAAVVRSGARSPEPGRLQTVDSDAGALRTLDVAVTDPGGTELAIVTLTAPLQPSRDAAVDALGRTAAAGAIALVLASGLLTLVVRRSLRPLRDLERTAAAVTTDRLDARVAVPDTGDEVQRLAIELNEMLGRLDEGENTRRRYLAAISHEVRTPLTVAEGHLELLEQGLGDPVATAGVVRGELDRLERVLDDLLAVARGVDDVDIRLGPVFVPDLFDAILTRAAGLGLADRIRVTSAPAAAFTGDQARIEQSISNLVSNAVDHNPATTTVTLSAAVDDRSVSIVVSDDGTGIDPAVLPHAHEPFVTTRPTGHRRASGLGLAVVEALTAAQRGTFDLRSGPTGTTATLTYPIGDDGSSTDTADTADDERSGEADQHPPDQR